MIVCLALSIRWTIAALITGISILQFPVVLVTAVVIELVTVSVLERKSQFSFVALS